MRIANPMYDVFFKFLMEDTDLAKELIGTIINQEILSLELRPQETTKQVLVIPNEMLEDAELLRFITRLSKPLLSERLLREAEAEEAMEEIFEKLESKIERIEGKLEKQAAELENKDKEIEKQAKELAELKRKLENLQK